MPQKNVETGILVFDFERSQVTVINLLGNIGNTLRKIQQILYHLQLSHKNRQLLVNT
jgi:hypothetical protein